MNDSPSMKANNVSMKVNSLHLSERLPTPDSKPEKRDKRSPSGEMEPIFLERSSENSAHTPRRNRRCDVRRMIKRVWDPIVEEIFHELLRLAQKEMQLTDAAKKKRRRAYKNHTMMRVDQIRWTQVSVNNRFGNSLPVEWTIEMLKSGQIIPRELPLIRVAKFKGKYRSVDNRRLFCFKTAGIREVPVVVIKEQRKMKQLFEKNKSKNNGADVRIIDVALNPKNLNEKVITYDPTGKRASQCWTVGQCIDLLDQLNNPVPKVAPAQPKVLEEEPESEVDVDIELNEPERAIENETAPIVDQAQETEPRKEIEGVEGLVLEEIVTPGEWPDMSTGSGEIDSEGVS